MGAHCALNPARTISLANSISAALGDKASSMGRICDGWMLHIRVKPNSCEARSAAARMAWVSLNSVTTQCDGTLPCAWQALAISNLARTTKGWLNCPADCMAWAGMAPWCVDTKSIKPKLKDCTRACPAIAKALCTAVGDSIKTWIGRSFAPATIKARSARSTSATDSTLGTMMCDKRCPALPAIAAISASKLGWSTACTRTATRAFTSAANASSVTSAACSASPPTGAPSSQSRVTSKTQVPNSCVISACSCRLLRIRASTPL